MHRRTVGVVFICIAAFLFGIRYLCAAIYGSNVSSWNHDLFQHMLAYVGNDLLLWSQAALAVGIGYLVWAEFGAAIAKSARNVKTNWNEFDVPVENGEHNRKD